MSQFSRLAFFARRANTSGAYTSPPRRCSCIVALCLVGPDRRVHTRMQTMSADATPSRLSPTARTALEGAADHPDHRVELPPLPAAARNGVIRSMLRAGLVEEVQTDGEAAPTLRATTAGLRAVAVQPASVGVVPAEQAPKAPGSELGDAAPAPATETALVAAEAPPGRISLRAAAEALLTAWDRQQGVTEALVALRAALARGARATAPGANASPAPTPSRRGYLPCSAVRRAPASPRSWNLPAGPHTRCAAFSPG